MQTNLTSWIYRRSRTGLLMVVTVWAGACGRFAPATDRDWERSADYRHARNAADAGDYRVAAAGYEKVLRVSPDAAQPHLELGVLYDEKLSDPIAAIYHYRRFLDLEPNSQRRQTVEGYIERAQLTLAAKLPSLATADPGTLMRLQTEKTALMQENVALRARVVELERAASTVAATTPTDPANLPAVVAQPAPAGPSVPPANAPVPSRLHIVQPKDTLYSIAKQYYGSSAGWEKIFAANRTVLTSKDQLKVGQQLVIP